MKYFWSIIVSLLFITACDDGDIIEQTFDFTNASVQKCTSSNVLYKINDKEALIFSTPESSFPNTVGIQNISLGSTTTLLYRKFSATTNAANICSTPTLSVAEEWTVSGGNAQITTTAVTDPNDPAKIVSYNHKIVLQNITFNAPDRQIVYSSYDFGSYETDVIDLKFDYSASVLQTCPGNNLLFKYNSNNALLLDIDPSLYNHQTIGTKEQLIDTNNKVTYRVYNGGLNNNYFCQAIPPTSPSLTEEWVAENGVVNTSGIIVVETTQQTSTTYKHIIKLRKTFFKKGSLSYSPSPDGDYIFGEIIN